MNSHKVNPGIIAISLTIALVALLLSGCGSTQSARNNSPAPSVSTPEVSVPSEPEASSPVPPTATSPEPTEPSLPPNVSEPAPEPAPVGPVSRSVEGEGFEVTITANPGEQITGGEIKVDLVARNTSGQERALRSSDGQMRDFVAYDTNGKEVWRWSNGRVFTQMPVAVSLEPDQSSSYTAMWTTLGLPPGDYKLEGYFKGLSGVTPSVSIRIKSE